MLSGVYEVVAGHFDRLGYAQTDPVVAYKEEGYEMFEAMIAAIQQETARRLFLVRLQQAPPPDGPEPTVSVE